MALRRLSLVISAVLAVGLVGLAGATQPAAIAPLVSTVAAAQSGGGSPMIEITKSCPNLRYLGRDATFEITVTNRGTGPAMNVVVTDTISGGNQFLNADNGGSRQGNNIVWNLGTMQAGQTASLKASFRCTQIGKVQNSARVSYCAEAMAACEMEVKGIPAILLECVDDPDPIEVGGTLTYSIKVINQGSQADTNIAITCTLPAEQQFERAGGATNGSASGQTVTFSPLPSLAPKASANWTVTVKGVRAGDTRFAVSMKSDQIDSSVNETESTTIYE